MQTKWPHLALLLCTLVVAVGSVPDGVCESPNADCGVESSVSWPAVRLRGAGVRFGDGDSPVAGQFLAWCAQQRIQPSPKIKIEPLGGLGEGGEHGVFAAQRIAVWWRCVVF